MKLSRKRPDFEKLSRRACDGTRTLYSPLRAIARAEGFSARLGSWPFSIQLGIKNWPKTSWIFFLYFFILNLVEYLTPKIPIVISKFKKLIIRLIIIMIQAQNWNFIVVPNLCELGFSSKIEVPKLGSARNLHSSSTNSTLVGRSKIPQKHLTSYVNAP